MKAKDILKKMHVSTEAIAWADDKTLEDAWATCERYPSYVPMPKLPTMPLLHPMPPLPTMQPIPLPPTMSHLPMQLPLHLPMLLPIPLPTVKQSLTCEKKTYNLLLIYAGVI